MVERVKADNEKFCVECGAIINAKAEICPKCGVRQQAAPSSVGLGPVAANGKSRIAAALFALLLGWVGAHRFYLGHIGLGILYVVFCATMIPFIVSLVEGILFLAMSDETFNRKYGSS